MPTDRNRKQRGKLRLIISPNGDNGSLSVYQDIRIYVDLFDDSETADLTIAKDRYLYIHIAKGQLSLNGIALHAGDGVKIRNEQTFHFDKGSKAEVLVFDMRPNELPEQ